MNEQALLHALEKLLQVPHGSLGGTTSLDDLSYWDSLAMIEFTALADEQFGVDVPAEAVRRCRTVNDLTSLISAKV